MKTVIIGGTGHVGTYLGPRLIELGHEVTVVSRKMRDPYLDHPAWQRIDRVQLDRTVLEKEGAFGPAIAKFKPDIVVDLISFDLASTRQLVEALRGRVAHFLHCGTVWVKGYVVEAPTREDTVSPPFGSYGIQKKEIEDYLVGEARKGMFPATLINPGHITGPGYAPVNPLGNHESVVFSRIAGGQSIPIPHFGLETLHHVHADDVAGLFAAAIQNWNASIGESFFAASPAALTLRGFADAVAPWFGHEPRYELVSWERWLEVCDLPPDAIAETEDHLRHGQCCSMEKAERLLGFRPRFSSLQAVKESVDWLVENGQVTAVPGA